MKATTQDSLFNISLYLFAAGVLSMLLWVATLFGMMALHEYTLIFPCLAQFGAFLGFGVLSNVAMDRACQ